MTFQPLRFQADGPHGYVVKHYGRRVGRVERPRSRSWRAVRTNGTPDQTVHPSRRAAADALVRYEADRDAQRRAEKAAA